MKDSNQRVPCRRQWKWIVEDTNSSSSATELHLKGDGIFAL
jgi:hypothetical protein